MSTNPSYDLRPCKPSEVEHLFKEYHGYKSGAGNFPTYCFAVFESGKPVAAFTWKVPAPGAAKSVCPACPNGVLALSRMVAVPREQRKLKHISKPLRRQMKFLIDRTRWPVLITYADEGEGHNGFVYKCSGWTPTLRAQRNVAIGPNGERVSTYTNGGRSKFEVVGKTWLQRFEDWACTPDEVGTWLEDHGWERVPIPGKVWKSGNSAGRWRNKNNHNQRQLELPMDTQIA